MIDEDDLSVRMKMEKQNVPSSIHVVKPVSPSNKTTDLKTNFRNLSMTQRLLKTRQPKIGL